MTRDYGDPPLRGEIVGYSVFLRPGALHLRNPPEFRGKLVYEDDGSAVLKGTVKRHTMLGWFTRLGVVFIAWSSIDDVFSAQALAVRLVLAAGLGSAGLWVVSKVETRYAIALAETIQQICTEASTRQERDRPR